MLYRRQDSFRYEFNEQLTGKLQLLQIADKKVTSSIGTMQLYNISPGGLKIETTLNFPDPKKQKIILNLSFYLNEEEIERKGEIVWKKILANRYQYGLIFNQSDHDKDELIGFLKDFAKRNFRKQL
ncbi:PilZ domain-containing protein [Halalkalibacter urbisdiaboli]|uniref:PilZ domain-containing protein n=1 Tax=Halalkalibacter urbisdiaboli TaxID=1960589 RepID=UPI0013FE157B|nr:PilZ domain-containing protein [Halalkalibacter urbisdiaboli]